MLKLYNYHRSSASFRVRIALNLKGLPYQEIPIDLVKNGGEQFSADYTEINPQNLVPTLQDGDKIITQSLAIIEYLDAIHPTPPLLPNDLYEQTRIKSFALVIAADIHPLNNRRVLQFLTNDFGLSEEKKNSWYQHWIAKGLNSLEKSLAKSAHTGDFCFGNSPTLADIFLIPQLFNAKRFHCDISPYPLLNKIDTHCQTLPAFINAWPKESV